jgi:hypothetical protein
MTHVVGAILLAAFVAAGLGAVQRPTSDEPRPEDATRAILKTFEAYPLVGMSAGHRQKDLDDFIFALVRTPAFPDVVDDIVVETMNALYQPVLDRYVFGESVPLADAQKAWRSYGGGLNTHAEQLVNLIRRINQRRGDGKKVRVLAGEPPTDWSAIKTRAESDAYLFARDDHMAAVVGKEVLARKRKALLLYGTLHLVHGRDNAIGAIEQAHPGAAFIIGLHPWVSCPAPDKQAAWKQFDARLAHWPVPSLSLIKGTRLAKDLDALVGLPFFGTQKLPVLSASIDAYLYLGPGELALYELTPAHVWLDAPYMAELRRRGAELVVSDRARAMLDPEVVRVREPRALFCEVEAK